jgi:hypothetical protein
MMHVIAGATALILKNLQIRDGYNIFISVPYLRQELDIGNYRPRI